MPQERRVAIHVISQQRETRQDKLPPPGFWAVRILKICRTSGQDLMSGRALNGMANLAYEL